MTFIDNEDDNPFRLKRKKPGAAAPTLAPTDIPGIDPDPFKAIRANSNVLGNQDADPDSAGKSLQLGQEFKTDPTLIDVDQKAWEKHFNDERNLEIARTNPVIQNYLANDPMAARVSKDDLPVLDTLTRFIEKLSIANKKYNMEGTGVDFIGKAIKAEGDDSVAATLIKTMQASLWSESVRDGMGGYKLGQLMERYRTGDAATRMAIDPEIKAILKEQETKPKSGATYVQNLLGGFLGSTWAQVPEIVQYGTYGAVTGAAVGGLAGGPPGAAAGLLAGGGAGLVAGFSIPMATTGAGHIYYSIKDIEGLSEASKQSIAMGGGMFVGLLGARGGFLFQEGVNKMINKIASDKLASSAINQFMLTATRYSAEGGAINGGQVLAELLSEQFAKMLGDKDLKTIANDKDEMNKLLVQTGQGIVDGIVLGGFLSLPHIIPGRGSRTGDSLAASKTVSDANKLDEVMKMAQESKTKERFPGMLATALKGGTDQTFFLDPQFVKENKNLFSYIPDLDRQLADNAMLGTEIKVQMSDYVAHTPPEVHEVIKGNVRQGSGGLTPTEAQAIVLAIQKADEMLALKAQQAAEAQMAPQAPIAKFRQDAAIIEQGLPPVAQGQTRLWRANRPGEVGAATQFTSDLPGIALPFSEQYKGPVSYVDVPTADLSKYEQKVAAATGAEFNLPPELAGRAAEVRMAPPSAEAAPPAAPQAAMTPDQVMTAIFGDQSTQTPRASPGLGIPGGISAATKQLGQMVDQILGRRVLPTPTEIEASIKAENESRIRAGIKAPTVESAIQQAQATPTPEALSVSGQTVTEQPSGRVTDSPPAEVARQVSDAEAAIKRDIELGPQGKKTLVEQLRAISESSAPIDASEIILLSALQRAPGNLAELRTFINEEAKNAGITDPKLIKDIHDRADAATAALSTKMIKEETGAVIHSLADPDARAAAIATGQAIDSTRHVQWVKPLLDPNDTDAAGRAAYNNHLLDVQKKLSESVFDTAREVTEKKATKAWKNNEAAMRPEAVQAVAQLPVVMVDQYARTGEAFGLGEQKFSGKLDRAEVDKMFTPEELRAMGVAGKFLSKNKTLTQSMFGKGETVVSADLYASTFGYKDGKTMMRDLLEFRQSLKETGETHEQRFSSMVDAEVASRMMAEHGDLGEIIERNTLKAAFNYAQDKVFGAELKALSKLSGKELMKFDDIKKLVDESVQNKANKDAGDAEQYKTLAGKHGRKAQELHDLGDFEGALRAKQDQIKASLLARHAIEVTKDANALARAVSKYADKPRVKAVDPEYNTRILQLIQATGLEIKGRTPEVLGRDIEATGTPSYNNWAQQRKDVAGELVPKLSYLENNTRTAPNIGEMLVSDSRELHNAIKTLEQLGKTADTVRVGNQDVKIEDILGVLEKQLEGIGDRFPERVAPKYSTRKALTAELLKTETIVRKADRLDPNGILNRVLIQPIKRAQDQHWLLRRKVAEFLKDVDHGEWSAGGKGAGINQLNNRVPNTTMKDKRGNPHELTRGNMLMVMLNWGTEEGRALMSNSLNSDVITVDSWLRDNATKKNWDFVENIWRMYDNIILPEQDKVYRAQRGFGMERPEAIDFVDGHGKHRRGGYMPLIQEKNGVLPVLRQEVIFDNRIFDALPSTSQKAELKAGKFQLSLDFDQMGFRIQEQLHAIAYREAVRDVSKIVEHPKFTTLMREAFGNEQASVFKPWVRDVANDGGRYDSTVAHNWQWVTRSLLKNAIQTFSGYNTATAAIHSPSAASNTMGELGLRTFRAVGAAVGDSYIGNIAKKIIMSPENAEKAADFAWKNSVELRSRWKSNNNDIRKSLGQWGRGETLNYYAEWWGQSIISYTDYMTATVAWHGGYQKAIDAGASHADAVAAGDQLVRVAHGSMAIADKSQFHRERNVQQFSAFYGFFNHVLNQTHTAGFEVRDSVRKAANEQSYTQMGKWLSRAAWTGLSSAFFYAVMQSFIHHSIRGEHAEDDHWGKKAADSLMSYGIGMFPIAREAGFAVGHAWSIASIPITALQDIPRRWYRDTKKWANEGGKFPLRTSIEMSGALGVRIGARQIARWAEEMQGHMRGDIPPPSDFSEWMRLFIYGHSQPIGTKKTQHPDAMGVGSGRAQGRQRRQRNTNPMFP